MPASVVVTESGKGTYAQLVTAGSHTLLADEPRPAGDDTGPSPYEYLLAALGTCTSMTLRMYAARKGWPLARVTVRLRHERLHAEDGEHQGRIDHITREIELDGTLDDEQRTRLIEIAERCPVHLTLTGHMHVETTVA